MPCVLAVPNFWLIDIPNHLFGTLHQVCSIYWNSAFALFYALGLHYMHLCKILYILLVKNWSTWESDTEPGCSWCFWQGCKHSVVLAWWLEDTLPHSLTRSASCWLILSQYLMVSQMEWVGKHKLVPSGASEHVILPYALQGCVWSCSLPWLLAGHP